MAALRGVAGAAWQVAQAGSSTQLEQATAALTEVRRRLYGILAEDGDTAGPAGSDTDADDEA
jgi:hypothetical protein